MTKIEICDSPDCINNRNGECSLSIVEIVDGQCGSYNKKDDEE